MICNYVQIIIKVYLFLDLEALYKKNNELLAYVIRIDKGRGSFILRTNLNSGGLRVENVFYQAKVKILQDYSDRTITNRISTIKLATVTSKEMARTLSADSYTSAKSVPAFYDPNNHTVFLNSRAISKADSTTSFIICYHELMHAASHHVNYQIHEANIFQSGIKIETYLSNNYSCTNRLFNEGIVQFLTTDNNLVDPARFGYYQEVRLITRLVHDLGKKLLEQAIFNGAHGFFMTRFDEHYGRGRFAEFSLALDKKHYQGAEMILDQRPCEFNSWLRPITIAMA
jgi:hypothetical protein